MPLTMFFDSLDNGLKNNSFYDVNRVDKHTVILFKEKLSKPLGLSKAYLYFKNQNEQFSNLEKIQLFYTDNREVELSLSNLKVNVTLEENLFQFTAPPNTNIK
jgi:outer membrane lipoprotein-sorting protein